ncbi:hypothetical protein IM511_11825 [Erythrobacteraceae bacterium E2-1 Yellow Sea]|nr:hypothetical protein [Erythrobacteraceae bacterium E2-1 Yellow Sea]
MEHMEQGSRARKPLGGFVHDLDELELNNFKDQLPKLAHRGAVGNVSSWVVG